MLARRARLLLAAIVLAIPTGSSAQSVGALSYASDLPFRGASTFGAFSGLGYVFRVLQTGVTVTGLSFFNPDMAGGGEFLGGNSDGLGGSRVWSSTYDVLLLRLLFDVPPETGGQGGASLVTWARVDGSSRARSPADGPPGAFWITDLAEPVSLERGATYAVYGIGDAVVPTRLGRMRPEHAPTSDPRIAHVMDATIAGAGYASAYPYGYYSTGASLELAAAATVPEPATVSLVALGLASVAGALRRRRR